jgi:hypothetical protein
MGIDVSKPNKLLLVATFRHYFIGLGLALNDKKHDYHLIFINQLYNDERNPIYQASVKMIEPFASVDCMPLRTSDFKQKNINRKLAFKLLAEKITDLKPVEIATGNDRRIEYQYSMNFARNILKLDVVGAYLDNGTGSYISFQKLDMNKYLARKWLDVPLKKLVYGSWFTRMQRFGGSYWTDKCYLTHPEFAPKRLKTKECVAVEIDFYRTAYAQKVIGLLISSLSSAVSLNEGGEGNILLVLPRGTVIEDIYGSLSNAEKLIKAICSRYENIFVKYHPADHNDVLNFEGEARFLPAAIPVEILYSVLSFDKVIGDTSTAILSAKWMLPNADVQFFDTDTKHTNIVKPLFEKMEIRPLES